MPTPAMLTVREAADILGVSHQAVHGLMDRGVLPHEQEAPRAAIRIPAAAVLARANGETVSRNHAITRTACRDFVLDTAEADSIDEMSAESVRDLVSRFIHERRPEWGRDETTGFTDVMVRALLSGR